MNREIPKRDLVVLTVNYAVTWQPHQKFYIEVLRINARLVATARPKTLSTLHDARIMIYCTSGTPVKRYLIVLRNIDTTLKSDQKIANLLTTSITAIHLTTSNSLSWNRDSHLRKKGSEQRTSGCAVSWLCRPMVWTKIVAATQRKCTARTLTFSVSDVTRSTFHCIALHCIRL